MFCPVAVEGREPVPGAGRPFVFRLSVQVTTSHHHQQSWTPAVPSVARAAAFAAVGCAYLSLNLCTMLRLRGRKFVRPTFADERAGRRRYRLRKAERIVTEIFDAIHDNVATKSDLAVLRSELRADLELLKRDVTIRLGSMIVMATGLLLASKFFG